MAAIAGVLDNSRLKAMVIPREHGAWGMMLVPLVTGAVVGAGRETRLSMLGLFIVAALSLFWLRTPVEALLGTTAIKAHSKQERATVLRAAIVLAVVAAVAIAALLLSGLANGLLVLGAISAIAFAAQAMVKKLGRSGRMPAQVIGAIGLTATGAGAYYVMTGRLDRVAFAVWIANWMFAANQIHFVQLRIRGSRLDSLAERLRFGLTFLLGTAAMVTAILLGTGMASFPPLLLVAFLPAMLRAGAWFVRSRQPLDVHKLGFAELKLAILFGALLCFAFLI
jgi:hypothetical protein